MPVQGSSQLLVMGNNYGGEAPFVIQFQDEFLYPGAALGIQVAGGFVRQEHFRLQNQGPGHRHPLLFAAGQLVMR